MSNKWKNCSPSKLKRNHIWFSYKNSLILNTRIVFSWQPSSFAPYYFFLFLFLLSIKLWMFLPFDNFANLFNTLFLQFFSFSSIVELYTDICHSLQLIHHIIWTFENTLREKQKIYKNLLLVLTLWFPTNQKLCALCI